MFGCKISLEEPVTLTFSLSNHYTQLSSASDVSLPPLWDLKEKLSVRTDSWLVKWSELFSQVSLSKRFDFSI